MFNNVKAINPPQNSPLIANIDQIKIPHFYVKRGDFYTMLKVNIVDTKMVLDLK